MRWVSGRAAGAQIMGCREGMGERAWKARPGGQGPEAEDGEIGDRGFLCSVLS